MDALYLLDQVHLVIRYSRSVNYVPYCHDIRSILAGENGAALLVSRHANEVLVYMTEGHSLHVVKSWQIPVESDKCLFLPSFVLTNLSLVISYDDDVLVID